MNSDQPLLKTTIKVDDIISLRSRSKVTRGVGGLILIAMVLWSVKVTIIEDTDWERMGSIGQVLTSAGRFMGIDFSLVPNLLVPAIETFMISCLGTLLGVIICVPATWFGARNITPFKPITYPIGRLLMSISRSIHEIVWALFFVAVLGLGALPGIFAIAVRSVGFIAKMSAEAIENVELGPVDAIRATGANNFQVLLFAILPQVLPQVLGIIFFEWEINIRRSAILGLVGAGGLGLVFFRQMNTFNHHGVTTVIIAILGIIMIGEVISHYTRNRVI
ncbi:MAG TPA: phosphonate ABC transporter, permease protein PhnE [Candidatus Lambdaproteobacteria bacterium]|nr:phosphonate ABC transporter, permease protein PhnE [Candidatus Lambdaproteobacteria bacterium]HIK58278.1 phosphonate ABC transporter, permease protein PhnE [Nitrospinaceae bacterium]HIO46703.1 phosphonate ABC transporter, permease protein PhnE [Candidatus Poribacteria bacterium]HIO81834.1 phosphonate ABC transporter, permease protein PhnE [Candidatus Poribacteria bacterium]|tara:strand:- start:755 stop:1585 length:831 start_codon:yes stop_codon:yes gene_type:complete